MTTTPAAPAPEPTSTRERIAIAMMVLGLVTFVTLMGLRVFVSESPALVFGAIAGWGIWFWGKTIRKVDSTRKLEEDHLRRTEEAKRDKAANAR